MNIFWISKAAAAIFTPLILFFLGWLFPRRVDDDGNLMGEADPHSVSLANRWFFPIFLSAGGLGGFLHYTLAMWLFPQAQWWFGERSVNIFPPHIAFIVPAIIGGVVCGILGVIVAFQFIFGYQARAIHQESFNAFNIDSRRAGVFVISILTLAAVTCTFQMYGTRISLYPDGLLIGRFWSFEDHMVPYSEVVQTVRSAMIESKNGMRPRVLFTIQFQDGTCWDTGIPFEFEYQEAEINLFFDELEQRTGKKLQLQELPPECKS